MRTLLLFDGLGSPNPGLLPALRDLYDTPHHRAFFDTVIAAVEQTLDYASDIGIAGPATIPLRDILDRRGGQPALPSNSVAAGIGVHAYQLCHLQPTQYGADNDHVGALGHSLGMQAAIVAGLQTRRVDEFLAVAADSIRLVVLTLIRGQHHAADRAADPEALTRYRTRRRGSDDPGPMASVSGMAPELLRSCLASFHSTRPRTEEISIGLNNSPTTQVLTGRTADLLEFHEFLEPQLQPSGFKFTFLANTIPFHSQRSLAAVRAIELDADFLGRRLTGAELKIPVYSTDKPGNLQDAGDLIAEFLSQMMVSSIDWVGAVDYAVSRSGAERIVDFGPGPGARVFTRDCMRATGFPAPSFESIHRVLQPR